MKGSIILIILLIFSSIASFGQITKLTGKVVNQDNIPLSSVSLSLKSKEIFSKIISDSLGRFSFPNLSSSQYELTISHTGYQPQYVNINLNNKTELEIKLVKEINKLGEIVVKDRYREIKKQEESLNLEIVNIDFIKRNLGGSLMKSLDRLPGIQTIGIGSGQSKPLIRGLGFNRTVVIEKGIKHEGQEWGSDHGLEIDQFATGDIEIIKGPASFMYGSSAIGGVIDVKPSPIPTKNTLEISTDLIGKSNNNLKGASINLNGRKQHWFFDSRFTHLNYEDYRVPTNITHVYNYVVNLNNNYLRNTAGKELDLHLAIGRVSDRTRSIFYFSNIYTKSGFFANAHGLEPRRVDVNLHDSYSHDILLPTQEVNHFKIINRSEYYLSENNKLEMELGYQRNFRQERSNYVNHGNMPSNYPANMTIPSDLEREFDKQTYSANLKNNLSAGKHIITTGINTEYQNNDINGWNFLVPAFKQQLAGIYVYDKLKLNDHVLLHGALRYDYGQIQIFRYTDWFTTGNEKITRAENLVRSFNTVIWSLGLNYNQDKFSFKTNVGKSFRMPIAKELVANGINYHYFSYEKGNPTLSAEKSYQADMSLGWNEDKWSIQASPFYSYFPNYIYLNPTSNYDSHVGATNQVFQYTQSKVIRYGGELQFKYNFLKTLSAELLGEYVLSRQLSGQKKGYSLPFSPPPSILFNLTYSPRFTNGFTETYCSLDYRITSEQHDIVPPEKKTEGYHLINFQAGTKVKLYGQHIFINLQIQNVLNKKYLNHTSFYRLIELPEAGRNIVLSLRVPIKIRSGE